MSTTTNLGLPIYGANDVPKWDDTNIAFEKLDNFICAGATIFANRGELLPFYLAVKNNVSCVLNYDFNNAKYMVDIFNFDTVPHNMTVFLRHTENIISANANVSDLNGQNPVSLIPIQSGYTDLYKESTLVHTAGVGRLTFQDNAWFIDPQYQSYQYSYYAHFTANARSVTHIDIGVSV